MKTPAIDLETFSSPDIKKVGSYKYAENCEIFLCAYAYDDELEIIDLAQGEYFPDSFISDLFEFNVLKTAYNAPFEMQVLQNFFRKPLFPAQWDCSMVLGLRLGLPAGLDEPGKVLRLQSDKQKFTIGNQLLTLPTPKGGGFLSN